jgi:hypothetical protein
MSIEIEHRNRSLNLSCKNINKNKKNKRPYSSAINFKNKNKKLYGVTALQNARNHLEEFREKKEEELFSRLQHKIKVEFLKHKTFSDYLRRKNHFDNLQEIRDIRRKDELYERQCRQSERLQTHYELDFIQKQLNKERINNYINLYNKKEKQIKLNNIKLEEKKREKDNGEEMKNQEAHFRLYIINERDQKRRNAIDKKIKLSTEKINTKLAQRKEEKKIYMQQKDLEKRKNVDYNLGILNQKLVDNYYQYKLKEKKDKKKEDEFHLRKEQQKEDIKINNFYRFADHQFRYGIIKNKVDQRNNDYFNKLKIIKKNKIMIEKEKQKKSEERKQMIEEKEDNVKQRLKMCEIASDNFREKTRNKIIERALITQKIKDNNKLIHAQKQEDNEERFKQIEFNKQQLELYDNLKKEQKMKKIDERKDKINSFINEKEKINEEKRYINDNFTNQYNFYSQEINELMYKRPMDKTSLNNIRDMVCQNPQLAGITYNIGE